MIVEIMLVTFSLFLKASTDFEPSLITNLISLLSRYSSVKSTYVLTCLTSSRLDPPNFGFSSYLNVIERR